MALARAERSNPGEPGSAGTTPPLGFEEAFVQNFDFVWRNLRRLGVADGHLDDAVQEVFLVLHRRWNDFEGRSSLRTWLFQIAVRVAADHRRSQRRKNPEAHLGVLVDLAEAPVVAVGASPEERAEAREAAALVNGLLAELREEHRTVFILAELEEMTMPAIAEALDLNVNTAYARLRAARREFEKALTRLHARTAREAP